jgi:hypothetical protein
MRTRYWHDFAGLSSTAVQFRDDADPMVFLHTNLGWVPIGNTPPDATGAERFAEEVAASYKLSEASQAVATYMAGCDDD